MLTHRDLPHVGFAEISQASADRKLVTRGPVDHMLLLLLFDDNKIKLARKPGKKQKENLVGYSGEGKR